MLNFAKKIALESGEILQSNFQKIKTIKQKDKNNVGDIVTNVDHLSDQHIIKSIQKKFPKHNVWTEESGMLDRGSPYTWIIDPLDGTRSYTLGMPQYAVSIALLYKKGVVLGVSYHPWNRDLFYAQKGKGSFLNKERIYVSKTDTLYDIMFSIGWSRQKVDGKKYIAIMRELTKYSSWFSFPPPVFSLCYVACGRMDLSITEGAMPWDYCAGAIIVEEARGVVRQVNGERWDFTKPSILATNKKLYPQVMKVIKPYANPRH
jgi:myo-inositol-1(or 4)-monophosphatase